MRMWTWMRVMALVTVLALALAPGTAGACVNAWQMTAKPGDGQVALAWSELPANHSAKIVRSIYGWPGDPSFGDSSTVAGCWTSEPDVVVYRGTERSVVDTTVTNGRTYWYTLFVRDDVTGQYLWDKSEVVATPGSETVSAPHVGTSYVRAGYRFRLYAGLSNKHTVDTKTVVVMSRKVDGRWVWARQATYTQREGTTWFSTAVAAPTTGAYRVVIKHVGIGERVVASPPKYFTSHR